MEIIKNYADDTQVSMRADVEIMTQFGTFRKTDPLATDIEVKIYADSSKIDELEGGMDTINQYATKKKIKTYVDFDEFFNQGDLNNTEIRADYERNNLYGNKD